MGLKRRAQKQNSGIRAWDSQQVNGVGLDAIQEILGDEFTVQADEAGGVRVSGSQPFPSDAGQKLFRAGMNI